MPDIVILADSPDSAVSSQVGSFPFVEMKRAILSHCQPSDAGLFSSTQLMAEPVNIVFTSELEQARPILDKQDVILCPLTLNLPDGLKFPGRDVFVACADLTQLRQHVAEWLYPVDVGTYWQPIVLTVKGALFAEVIAPGDALTSAYTQPLHLGDAKRQPLYELGQRLVRSLAASPGVYLMQFGMDDTQVWFDRLIPFPDVPAIASVGVQTPDLFECHWRCLMQQPIRDLSIRS